MFSLLIKKATALTVMIAIAFMSLIVSVPPAMSADHAESTSVADDPAADIGDAFIFLDPNDNTKVVLAMTVSGFIVPSELLNLSFFPSQIVYRFEIENTGDARADRFIDVVFSEQTGRNVPQTATIYPEGIQTKRGRFTAPATLSTFAAAANPFVVTTDRKSVV